MEHIQNVLDDIKALVPMGGVTVPENKTDLEGLYKRRDFVVERAKNAGLEVIEMKESAENPCPFLIITFPEMLRDGKMNAKIALVGHMDVVDVQKPEQFSPKVEGDFIHGRGTTDMLGVDSVFLEWMRAQQKAGGSKPPFMLMLSFTEENDSALGHNTYTAREFLEKEYGANIEFAIIGERTGEMSKPDEPVISTIRDSNYGLRRYRFDISLKGKTNDQSEVILHSVVSDLITEVRQKLAKLNSKDNTGTTFAAPFLDYRAKFDTDLYPLDLSEYKFIRVSTVDENTSHSAQSKPSVSTPAEKLFESLYDFQYFTDVYQLLRFSVGQGINNYNTISSSNVIELAYLGIYEEEEIGRRFLNGQAGKVEIFSPADVEREIGIIMGIETREAPEHSGLISTMVDKLKKKTKREFRGKVSTSTERSGWVCDQSNEHLGNLRSSFTEVTGEEVKPEVKVFFNDGSAFIHSCDGHTHSGQPIARAVVFGGVGYGPHGPMEKAHIPGFETLWKELDALKRKYV